MLKSLYEVSREPGNNKIVTVMSHGHHDVSKHELDCLFYSLLLLTTEKISKFYIIGDRLNITMPSYQYMDSHVKDETVSPTVLFLTWKSPYLAKTVFILRRGPGPFVWRTGGSPAQMVGNTESIPTPWRHHAIDKCFLTVYITIAHDDVIKRKHYPLYWSFVRGIHQSLVNSQHKCQWRGALMFSLIIFFASYHESIGYM